MTFDNSINTSDLLYFIGLIVAVVVFYFRGAKVSDERIVTNESNIKNLRSEVENQKRDCDRCKTDFSQAISDVENRTNNRFGELGTRINSMENSIRGEIQSLGKTIIDIINKK